jgi:hypothetical protein
MRPGVGGACLSELRGDIVAPELADVATRSRLSVVRRPGRYWSLAAVRVVNALKAAAAASSSMSRESLPILHTGGKPPLSERPADTGRRAGLRGLPCHAKQPPASADSCAPTGRDHCRVDQRPDETGERGLDVEGARGA